MGIPHPPGYPLYTLVAHAFTWLPLETALAVNLMSAVFGVLSVVACYCVGRELGASRGSASAGAALLGLGHTFWSYAIVAEAYTAGTTFLLVALWLALRAARLQSKRVLFFAGLVSGCGLGMHLSLATTGLSFVGLSWLAGGPSARPGALIDKTRVTTLLTGAAGACLGACVFLYLPLRAHMAPAMNFGDPSNVERFISMLTGGVYKHWFLESGDASRALAVALEVGRHVTLSGLPLAVAGLWVLKQQRGLLWSVTWAAGIAGNLAYFWRYQVHDLEVFFLPSAAMCSVGAALGLDLLLATLRHARPKLDTRYVLLLVGLGLLIRAVRLYPARDLSRDRSAWTYGEQVASVLPKHSIVVTYTMPAEWKYHTVFRWYVKLVRNERPDVSVMPFASPELIRQLLEADHPVFTYVKTSYLKQFTHEEVPGVDEGLLRLGLAE